MIFPHPIHVIPGRAPWRGPGIHTHCRWLWIPGSRYARPGMTNLNAVLTEDTELNAKSPDLDSYIDAVGSALGLAIDPAWKPAVRANLEISLKLARQVDEFALPDETEPASVFSA